jgi:hypothetical protein
MPFVIGEVEVTNEVTLAPSAVLYDGAVVADGDLTVLVNNFFYDLGGTKGKYAGSVGNAVTDNITNYVYLNSSAALVINTTGYPASVIHLRLARVVASGGFIVRVILERALFTASSVGGTSMMTKSATDPGGASDGDVYFNTVLEEVMEYDGTRSKWLSVAQITLTGGRSTETAAGSFYRGIGNLTFGTNIGYGVPKGTLVGLSWSRTDSDAATLEVLVGGSVIATLASSAAGVTADWTKNANFNAGLLQFRNQAGGNTTTDVMITALLKRRI